MFRLDISPSTIYTGKETTLRTRFRYTGDRPAYHVQLRINLPHALAHIRGRTRTSTPRIDPGGYLETNVTVRPRAAGTHTITLRNSSLRRSNGQFITLNDLSETVKVIADESKESTSRDQTAYVRKQPHTVFISYASQNERYAFKACKLIEASGIRCAIAPRDIRHGKGWKKRLVRLLDKTKLVVLIYSEAANESKQVRREIDIAYENNQPILTFVVQKAPLCDDFRYCISKDHWLDATRAPRSRPYKRLVRAVHRILLEERRAR